MRDPAPPRSRSVTVYRTLLNFAIPASVLIAASVLVLRIADLPASLAGLKIFGAYVLLALGCVVGLAFRRGRVVFALLSLVIAYVSNRWYLQPAPDGFTARTVFVALCVFVPLNLGVLSLLKERGTFNIHGLQRLAVILLQMAFTSWIVLFRRPEPTAWAYAPLIDTALFAATPVPQLGLVAMALSVVTGITVWSMTRSATALGLAGATVGFGIAAHGVASPDVFEAFIAASALILTVAVLQDALRMAFRDELTGLPSRSAFNERLAGLGRHYTIALLDVDHFKSFNDTYGHDVGDQVLKMIAARLAEIGGGGGAYRYGGEEFTVVFPGKSIGDVLPHVEALRKGIAGYKLALRRADRPDQAKSGRKRRGAHNADQSVSLTVSIGMAERGGRLVTPDDVVQAADQALYRAKHKGRNQVSR